MRKVLIVDDETLVRVTLRSMVAWETYGMQVAADCNSGYQALEYLEEPMRELANQIPKVRRNGKWITEHPGHYIFLYSASGRERYQDEIRQVLKQMQSVWKNYMNLTVSAGICDVRNASELEKGVEEGESLLFLAPLLGRMALISEWENQRIIGKVWASKEKYERFLTCLYEINEPESEKEKQLFFQALNQMPLSEAKEETLSLIALLAFKFREYDDDFFQVFPENVNYFDKIGRLTTMTELERWVNNYITWIREYLRQQLSGVQTDIILRAKRFISDNFSNPELSLKSVADYVGLNEKYFTTKFTQKTGSTFRDYLTGLRVERAKYLLKTTDLKIYEICESIGYHNVEHFNRMFKRLTDVSPSAYRREMERTDKTSRNQT